MVDNRRFKVNAYIQVLRYIDDAEKRNKAVNIVLRILESIPDTAKRIKEMDDEELEEFLVDEYKKSDIRKAVIAYAEDHCPIYFTAKDVKEYARVKGIKLDTTLRDIGIFITNSTYFFEEIDGYNIRVIPRGTGSNAYEIREKEGR